MSYKEIYEDVVYFIDEFDIKYPLTVEDLIRFIEQMDFKIHSYTEIANEHNVTVEEVAKYFGSKSGVYHDSIICYNDTLDEYGIIFTLAHEFYHPFVDMTLSKVDKEKACNCFARNFINPIPKMERISIDEIKRFANYSATGLNVRIKLLQLDMHHFENILNVTYIPTTNNEFIMMPNTI